jgi:Spy/CpxP family protein refolding chaperone
LTKDQEEEVAKLEKEVKERLSKVLTAEQKKKADDIRPPRPGDPGRPPQGDRPPRDRGDNPPPLPPRRFELGQVLPPFAREQLELTKEQEDQVAKIEKEVKDRLSKVLTAEQRKKADDIRPPRPGGPPVGERADRPAPREGGNNPPPPPPPRFELGQVLPPPVREELRLTKEQEEQLARLEKEAKERLSKILTAEQKQKVDDFRPPRPPEPPPE